MEPTQIGDLVIFAVTVITQILLIRLFFAEWRRRLPRPVFLSVLAILALLWLIMAFDAIAQAGWHAVSYLLPAVTRGFLFAIGATWGVTVAASLAIYFAWRFLIRRLSPRFSADRRTLVRAVGVAAVASPFAAMAFGGISERTNFQVKEVDFPVPDLHPDLEGFRIAQVSDLHVSPFLSLREAARVVDMTNELRPNLTVFTGDLISTRHDPIRDAIREIGRLRADAGVLGCLGNHEFYARCQKFETAEAGRYGIHILRGEARQLRVGRGVLNVAGVDYQSISKKSDYLRGAEKLTAPGSTNLLLSHNPDVFPVAVRKGFDAVLSGHTHGGQVNVEILSQSLNVARFFTPYVIGLYRMDGRSCYVTPGIGTIGVPIRLGARPEISLLRLRRA